MPAGLRTYDASGNIMLDLTDRLTRVVAVISIGASASGSIQLPEGTAWYALAPGTADSYYQPNITVSGSNLLSYSPSTTTGTPVATTMIVGVY